MGKVGNAGETCNDTVGDGTGDGRVDGTGVICSNYGGSRGRDGNGGRMRGG